MELYQISTEVFSHIMPHIYESSSLFILHLPKFGKLCPEKKSYKHKVEYQSEDQKKKKNSMFSLIVVQNHILCTLKLRKQYLGTGMIVWYLGESAAPSEDQRLFLLPNLGNSQPTIILAPGVLMLFPNLCWHLPRNLGHTIISYTYE